MALPVPVPDPFFWWTSFSRVKRHWGLFQINLEPLEVQNTNAPPLFPKKVFHHQVLPGPTSYHFPPLKFGTHLGSVEPLTCCYSVRIHEAFAICPNQWEPCQKSASTTSENAWPACQRARTALVFGCTDVKIMGDCWIKQKWTKLQNC